MISLIFSALILILVSYNMIPVIIVYNLTGQSIVIPLIAEGLCIAGFIFNLIGLIYQ